jgi:hypothetical protein
MLMNDTQLFVLWAIVLAIGTIIVALASIQ